MYYEELDHRHVAMLQQMLDMNACEPGFLMPFEQGHVGTIMNQMLYDKFHGHGWELNLLTGRFVKTKGE